MRANEFEKAVRVCLASLYEHAPRRAAIFIVFGPYSPERTCFHISTSSERKLDLAIQELGLSTLCLASTCDGARRLKEKCGQDAALSLTVLFDGNAPLEGVLDQVMIQFLTEVPKHPASPFCITDLEAILLAIGWNPKAKEPFR